MTRLITSIRATTSVIKKSYKIQKIAYFTYFDQKNTHISGCKIVHKCISATITVYICTVTVTLLYIILVLFLSHHILSSPESLSLSLQLIILAPPQHRPSTTTHIAATQHHQTPPPPTTPTTTRTHHKINQKSNKSTHGHTTKSIKNQTHPHPHKDTPTETKRAFLWTCGCGSIGMMLVVLWLWIVACGSLIGDRGSWIGEAISSSSPSPPLHVDWCLWVLMVVVLVGFDGVLTEIGGACGFWWLWCLW